MLFLAVFTNIWGLSLCYSRWSTFCTWVTWYTLQSLVPVLTPTELLVQDFWSGTRESSFLKGAFGIKRPTASPGSESSLGNTISGRENSYQRRVVATYISRQENSNPNLKISHPLEKIFLNCAVSAENTLCFSPLKCLQLGPGAKEHFSFPSQLVFFLDPGLAPSFCGLGSVSPSDLIMMSAWSEKLLAFELGLTSLAPWSSGPVLPPHPLLSPGFEPALLFFLKKSSDSWHHLLVHHLKTCPPSWLLAHI